MEGKPHCRLEVIDPFGDRFFRHLPVKPLIQLRQQGQFHFRFPRFPGAFGGPESDHPFTALFVFKSASAGTGIVAPDHGIHTSQENSSTFQYTTNPRGNKDQPVLSKKKRKRKNRSAFPLHQSFRMYTVTWRRPIEWLRCGSRRKGRSHFPSRRPRCLPPLPRRIPECRFSSREESPGDRRPACLFGHVPVAVRLPVWVYPVVSAIIVRTYS